MAGTQGSWKISDNKLIFSIGSETVASIGGSFADGYVGTEDATIDNGALSQYLSCTPHQMKSDGGGLSKAGVITLQKGLIGNGDVTLTMAENYSGSYSLAIAGETAGRYGGDAIAAGWKADTVAGSASYYKGGKKASWSLSGTSIIKYTPENPGNVLVAITGFNTQQGGSLSNVIGFKEWTSGQSGILTLSSNALSGNNSDFKIVQGSGSYTLSLDNTVTKFDALSSTNNPYVTAENGSASIVRVQSAGWSLASLSQVSYSDDVTKILAKISGLSNTAASSNISINNAAAMKVTLASGALSTKTIQIKDADEHDNYKTFSLSLAAGISEPGKYFLNPKLVLPDTKNGSASIIGTKTAGWSLSGTSFVNYTAASQSVLAKISGLSMGASAAIGGANMSLSGLPTGSTSTATIGVVLQTGALSTLSTTPATVTDNYAKDGFKFRFFLSGVSAPGEYFVDPKLESVTNGSASIMGTKYAGWSLSSVGNNTNAYVNYTAASQSILATIAGLSKTASTSNVFLTGLPGTGLSVGRISVLLSEGALSKGATPATLVDKFTTDKFDFKFGFSGSYSQPDKQYGNAFLSIASVASGGTSNANILRNLTDGWSLSGTTFVKYTAASTATLATITGLSSSASTVTGSANISLSGTLDGSSTSAIKVMLQEGALIRSKDKVITLTDKIAGDSFTFALATSGVSTPAEKYENFALSSVANGSASILGSKFEGWTVDASASKVTYTPKIESILAKISGLSTGATIETSPNISLMGSDSTIVQLQKGALSFAESIPVSLNPEAVASGINFSLSLAAGISAPYAVLVGNPSLSYFKNGSASILGTKSEGWTLAGLSVTYKKAATDAFLGTIKGLSMGASAANVALIGGGSRIVQLKNGSLSKAGITLNGKDTRTYGFSLSFGNIAEKNADGSVGFESIYYWKKDKNDPTAYYKSDKAEGWVLAGDSHSVVYSARNTIGNGVATITNLSKNVEAVQGAVSGITVAGGKIILAKDVLDTGKNSYTMTLALGHSLAVGNSTTATTLAAGAFGLSLAYTGAGSVPQKLEKTAAWISLGEKSTYASISAAYWKLADDNKSIEYTPQVNGKTLAIVTGLNSAVTADDMKVGGESVITLYKNALAAKDVTFENNVGNYSLSLFRSTSILKRDLAVAAPTLSGQAWSIDGTTAKYTASVQAGYEVANDAKSIIYASTNDSVLATITGLSSGLTVSPDKQFIGLTNGNQVTEGLKFGTGDEAKVINLTGDVLTTNSVKLETKSVGRNYSLSFATANVCDPGDTVVSAGISVWRLNGTTAEYKKVQYAHYSLSSTKDEIIYTPEADVAGGLVAKITGLKNGLAVGGKDGTYIGVKDTVTGVISGGLSFNTTNTKQIDLKGEVLGATNVSLSAATGYSLSLAGADALKPKMGTNLTWSLNSTSSSTTAELRGIKTEGYSVASNNQAINYIGQDDNYLFAQVAGLKGGLALTGKEIKGVSLSVADKTITLDNRVLGRTNVTLDNKFSDASFSLALDTTTTIAGASVNTANNKEINVWAFDTNKATFKKVNEVYYTLAGDSHGVTFNDRKDVTDGTIVTISGLRDGLSVVNDKIAGIDLITGSQSYTIANTVLNSVNVTISPTFGNIGSYTFKLADNAAPVAGTKGWGVDGTTANYQYTSTAGYIQESLNGNITFKKERDASDPNIIAQIKGIKEGLKANTLGGYIIPTVTGGDSIMFKLDAAVLGSTSITVSGGKESVAGADYTIVLKDPDTYTVKENQLGWVKNGKDSNVLDLHYYTAKGFSSASGSTVLKYYEQKLGASIAGVSGLKTNLSISDDYQINGIGFSVADTSVILQSGVLNSKDVTITDYTSGVTTDNFALSLADSIKAPEYTMAWAINNSGTATLTEVLNAGYSVIDEGNGIKYSAKETVKTTIAGLNKTNATVSSDKWSIDGIKLYDEENEEIAKAGASTRYTIPKTGTFVIDNIALNKKDLVLSSGASYGLSLAQENQYITLEDAQWAKTVGSAQALYIESAPGNGYVAEVETELPVKEIKYYSKGNFKTLATLNGLNKTATATQVSAGLSVSSKAYGGTGGYSTASIIYVTSKDILTNTNLTIGTKDNYVLALDDSNWTPNKSLSATEYDAFAVHDAVAFYTYSKGTVNVQAGKTEGWAIKTTKPRGASEAVKDPKTIVYTKAAPLTIATVTGLKSGLADSVVSSGFSIENWTRGSASTGTGVIKLSNSVLDAKDVKITVPTKLSDGTTGTYGFSFALDTNIPKPEQGANMWVASVTQAKKGTLHYQYNTTAGYSLASISSTTLKYSKDTDTVLATITGLKNLGTATISAADNNISYLDVTTAYSAEVPAGAGSHPEVTGVIALRNSDYLGTSVKVTNGAGKYIFDIDDSFKVSDGGSKWFLSGTTGTYKFFTTEGWKLGSGSTTATYQKETGGTTLVTVKGLKKGLTVDQLNNATTGLAVTTDTVTGAGTVKITPAFEGTTTISLTNGKETYENSSGSSLTPDYIFGDGYTTIGTSTPTWTYKKGTATLTQKAANGFTLSTDAKKLTYKKGTTYTLATITGLAGDLQLDANYTGSLLTKGAIATKLTGESASSSDIVVSLDNTGYITLKEDALTSKNVTLKNGKNYEGNTSEYKLKLGSDVRDKENEATEWIFSGTTGTYKVHKQSYYTVTGSASTSVKYTKPTAGTTYATVTGLNKTKTTADLLNAKWDGTSTGGVLTVTKDMLDTATIKMTAKTANTDGRDTFTLALADDVPASLKSSLNVGTSVNATSGGKAVIQGTFSKGFYLENGNKTLTYYKAASKPQTVATVTGLKANSKVTVDKEAGTIGLDSSNLTTKNIAVTTSKGTVDYKFVYNGDLAAPSLADANDEKRPYVNVKKGENGQVDAITWTNPKGTGTLKGYIATGGYTMAGSSTSITYTAPTATKDVTVTTDGVKATTPTTVYKSAATLATFKGLQIGAEIAPESDTINLSGSDINGNLTISKSVYDVKVDSTYSSRAITGSANADNITVEGGALTVTGGKGDDYIYLGNANSNTFVYSNGDGNDVIANFALGQDKLQVKSGTIAIKEVKDDDTDVVVKVGTGSITLKDVTADEITIYNSKNVATTYAVPHAKTDEGDENVLLADNNYRMDAAQLSDIIKPAAAQYTPYDFSADFSLTKEEKFTPEIAYTDKK